LLRFGQLGDAALLLEKINTHLGLVLSQVFHRPEQFGVFLAHNLVEQGGPHSSLLQLFEGLARFDALMLPSISDQQHAVLRADLFEELAHLLGARKGRLVEHVEMAAVRVACNLLAAAPT
jgi:hypothetical protein